MNTEGQYSVDLVALHITAACNHRCAFCYMSDIKQARPKHPEYDRLARIVDALSVADVREITFLGGDPAIYPRVVGLAKHCHEKGLAVSILSNTHQYPGSSVEEAARFVSAFETTIHAPSAQEHDEFCQKQGAFEFVLTQLRRASEHGRKVGIAMNVTPASAGRLFSMALAVREDYGVPLDYIIVQRIIPQGRAQTTSSFTINREHAERALSEIERIDNELGIRISVEDPFPVCILPRRLRKYMNPCQWGFTKAAVNDQGDLSRCGADPRCRLGNVLETPLLELWNNAPTLVSFRERKYLPGRCQTCSDLNRCGGGCPLSCEIEKDHGLDYLFLEYQRLDARIHGELQFDNAREEELSSILQIEWNDFPTYEHIFTVASIRQWYEHNPGMFYVLRDAKNWVMAYACLVPVSQRLHNMIVRGQYSALTSFPRHEVLRQGHSPYYHVEVVASIPTRSSSHVGRFLIRSVGELLTSQAECVTASPVTDIGDRLCKYFGFEHVAYNDSQTQAGAAVSYPISRLWIDRETLRQKLERF